MIAFCVCAGFVALALVAALFGSQALGTFFRAVGGALLGALIGGALGVGSGVLYLKLHPDASGFEGFMVLLPVGEIGAVAGAAVGAMLALTGSARE